MRLQSIFALLTLPIVLAATNDIHEQLIELAAASNGNIKLDSHSFELLTSSKRTWSVALQFTALDKRRRCAPCSEFEPSFNAVAKAWKKTAKEQRDTHFFATLDFDDGQMIFQQVGLVSAPAVFVYPATEGPRRPKSGRTEPSKYDFSNGFDAESLADSMSQYTPVRIPYVKPIDWARWATIGGGVVAFLASLPFIKPILTSRWIWAAGTVVTSLVMTSGYMFTRIRGVPWTGGGGNWIAAGYQNQYGQEVQVIALIYGFLAFAFLMLIMVIPYQSSPGRQRVQVYLWNAVIMLIYSVLITIFKVKNRGYPFKLLF